MEYYLPHALVLIGFGKRIDSVQPEKNSISRKRKKKRCTPFFLFGRTERPDRLETNSRLFDVDEHHRRLWGYQLVVACVKYTVRADSAGEAQDSA